MTALRRSRSGRSRAPRVFGGGFAALCVAAGGLAVIAGGMGTSGAASSHGTKSVVVTTSKSAKFGTILVSAKTFHTLNASKTSRVTGVFLSCLAGHIKNYSGGPS